MPLHGALTRKQRRRDRRRTLLGHGQGHDLGALAVTTWGAGLFEPATAVLWAEVARLDPALVKAFKPWDELTSPAAVAALFARARTPDATAQPLPGAHRLDEPGQFWDIVLGSGYRATVDALPTGRAATLRERGPLPAPRQVTELRTDVIFGSATRHTGRCRHMDRRSGLRSWFRARHAAQSCGATSAIV